MSSLITIKQQAPYFFATALFTAALHAQDAAEWQRQAVVTYPDLAKEGSPIHTKFLSLYNELKQNDPQFFDNPKWPTLIADRAMAAIRAEIIAARRAASADAQKKAQEEFWKKNTHSIREVRTDQISFLDKPFAMSGSIEVSDYYGYGYSEARKTHYSFELRDGTGQCHVYMERDKSADLRKQLLAAGGSLKGRFTVVILSKRHEKDFYFDGLNLELLYFGPAAE
ncbi:MAG: hypothetical protein WCK49_10190 [Myxococcaceae bacterium]